MKRMTKAEAEALSAFIMRVRPQWRPAGIMAALEKASPGADVFDVARAAINLASEPSVLTPGLLPAPGPHWRNPGGELPPRRGDHNMRCPDHPDHDMPHDHGADPPEQVAAGIEAAKAALRAAPKYVPPAVKRAQALEAK